MHAVAIQLINSVYRTITEPAVRPAVCNTPCSFKLSYSVLKVRRGILTSCALALSRLNIYIFGKRGRWAFGGGGVGGSFYSSNTLERNLGETWEWINFSLPAFVARSLVSAGIKYHKDLEIWIPFNQGLALIVLRATGLCLPPAQPTGVVSDLTQILIVP